MAAPHAEPLFRTLDSGSTTDGVLGHIQSPDLHADGGVVRAFEAGTPITGAASLAAGSPDVTATAADFLGVPFTNGFGLLRLNPTLVTSSTLRTED